MRINWFSPLPPARSGIARCTSDLLPALRKQADVVAWTEQEKWDTEVDAANRVCRFDPKRPSWSDLHKADVNVYNIGNNVDFHAGIWELSQQMPGIVILHDTCLQHLFAAYYLEKRKDRGGYIREMTRYYGDAGRRTATSLIDGACNTDTLAIAFPLTALAVEGALGVVVHTLPALRAVTQMSNRPVLYAPLPYQPATEETRQQWAQFSQQRDRPPYKIVVFGYLGPNRRLEPILRALSEWPGRAQFRLSIYGTVWDPAHVRKLIHSCGLDSLVEIHGHAEDLDRALADADLALNLRYPTMGEASFTQLHLWDHAIPTMVTRIGWYATLSDDAVLFVRPEAEVEDIQAGLQSFLDHPGNLSHLGERGRQVLDADHTPDQYAASLVAFIPQALRQCPRTAALSLADRVAGELNRWAPVYVEGKGSDHFAKVIGTLAGVRD